MRVTRGAAIPSCREILVDSSYDTVFWMAAQGMEMEPAMSLSGVKVGDMIMWPPGAVVRAVHEGVGLSRTWFETAQEQGHRDPLRAPAPCGSLQDGRGRVTGVGVRGADGFGEITAKAVVLGCGGFEANPECARATSAARGARQGARHALQHGRRAAHGDDDRRDAVGPVDAAATRRRSAPSAPPTATASSPTRPTGFAIPTA